MSIHRGESIGEMRRGLHTGPTDLSFLQDVKSVTTTKPGTNGRKPTRSVDLTKISGLKGKMCWFMSSGRNAEWMKGVVSKVAKSNIEITLNPPESNAFTVKFSLKKLNQDGEWVQDRGNGQFTFDRPIIRASDPNNPFG